MTLRILDVGAHDGFISSYIASVYPQAHIDAIELQPAFAQACQNRISGTCRVGAAEDAPRLFEPHSYDVVVAFELIEHVTDVTRFLEALEAMVTPEGRIYISTPNTTFGEGSNPHHLRTYRAVDLADTLRRRGHLVDMEVGSDGIVTAVYKPRPRREDIAFYLGGCWAPWHPADIANKGLGGSETAAVRLAEELSNLGFVVTVYGDVTEDVIWADVIFRHHLKFDPLDTREALICSRIPEIGDRPIAARTRLLWLHDTDCADRLTPARAQVFDHVLVLSKWHRRHVRHVYPFLTAKQLVTVSNAITHRYFTPRPLQERKPRVLYTSSPDRGLDVILEQVWPRVLEQAPQAELWHAYADVYDAVADQDDRVKGHRDLLRHVAAQYPDSVKRLGSLSQPQLAALMCESRVWIAPSWASLANVPFNETFCIGAVEAQAAGCRVVASGWGALKETVRWGALVNSQPGGPRWIDGLVRCIVEGLTDDTVMQAAIDNGPPAVADQTWAGVAEQVGRLVAAGARRRTPRPTPVTA